ncbi:MAG: type II toxin-antitoxin system RelE/ParE family toxin [Candidatus Micrarchaeota archaeon]
MIYKLIFSDESLLQLRKLDNPTAKRIIEKLETTLENPDHFFERLAGREESKIRIGDYRIIARILRNDNIVFLMSIGHRKNIYERR